MFQPICSCGTEDETTAHCLPHCPNYLYERKTLLHNIKSVLPNILEQSYYFINVFLFGDTSLDDSSNKIIQNAAINYVISTKRFHDSIFTF